MNTLRRLTAALVLAAGLLPSAPSRAADSAQGLYDRGFAAFKAGRFDEACPALEQSYKLEPLPGALFTLAECEGKRGRFAVAATRYDEYLRVYAALSADKQAKQGEREKLARTARAAISLKVAELTLVLPPGAPRETEVTRDGAVVPAAALGVPVLVDPGEHVVKIQVPGEPAREMRVSLAPGEKKGVALDARQAGVPGSTPAVAPQPGAEQGSGGASKGVLIAGGAIAGASAIAGAVFAGLWASKGSSAKSLNAMVPKSAPCPVGGAGATGNCASVVSALKSQTTFGNTAIGTFAAAGAVGIATVVYGVAGSRGPRSALVVTPIVTAGGGGVFAGGSF